MVKIDSYEALLDYWLHFTKVVAHLQVMSQLSSIKKDDLFLKGILLGVEGSAHHKRPVEGLRGPVQSQDARVESHEGSGEMQRDLQDSLKLSKAPGESSRGQALKVDSIEVAVAELSCSPLVEGQWQPLTAELQGEHLQAKREEQSKEELLGTKPSVELEVTEAKGDSPVPQSKTVERPVEPAMCALEVLKPPLEPKDDLHEAPEQAGSCKVEEVKQKIEAKMRSKGWTQSLGVETCATSPSVLSQPAKRSGATTLCVNDAHSLAPHTCSDAAMKFYAGQGSPLWWVEHKSQVYSNFQHSKTDQEGCLKYQDTKDTLLYGVLHQVFKTTKLGIELKRSPGPHLALRTSSDLKHAKVFEGSNQLKTPSKLSFRFQGAVVPSMSSTELEGSSLLQQSVLSLF
ncbi:hypothetical protein EDD16DRAFT_1521591 [Pisolithus croceorrhizus]|nr:hypothetical protein EDD16DRAFT_1521591 [Pisolithus croceorrhizus]KAI6118628.1 hypothetical protein EV401DRAFT_1888616 [Pisolithus croceorrhizus]KAI6138341.1 hypothetical protein EDD17DRAFT_1516892 [Pisolithus thermaeus]